MKKIYFLCILTSLLLFATSCSGTCKLETVNENGETITAEVNKTEDPELVLAALQALSAVPETVAEEAKNVSADIDVDVSASQGNHLLEVKGSASIALDIKNVLGYFEVKGSAKLVDGDEELSYNVDTKAYLESELVYMDVYFQGPTTSEDDIVDVKQVSPVQRLLLLLGGMSNYLPGNFDLEDLIGAAEELPSVTKEEMEEMIKLYNITIPKTSYKSITFRLESPLSDDIEAKIALDIEIDAKTRMPLSMSVDAEEVLKAYIAETSNSDEEVKSKFKFEIEFKYDGVKVKKLTDSEKEEYSN